MDVYLFAGKTLICNTFVKDSVAVGTIIFFFFEYKDLF